MRDASTDYGDDPKRGPQSNRRDGLQRSRRAEAGAKYDERHIAAALSANCVGVAQWLVEKGLDVNAAVVLELVPKIGNNTVLAYLASEGLKYGVAGGKNTEMTPKKPAEKKAEKK